MKNLTIFLSLLLLLSACQKDEEITTTEDVIGVWNVTAISCDDGTTLTVSGSNTFSASYKISGKNYNLKIEFKSDDTFSSTGTYTQVLSTTLAGNTTVQEFPSSADFGSSGTFEVLGTSIRFKQGAQVNDYDIVERSSKKLRLKYALNSTKTDDLGDVVTQKATIYTTLEK